MERKLKIILCILIAIIVAMVAFIGVYAKDSGIFKSKLPDYLLASEFEGKRLSNFIIDDGTQEIIYDKDGNIVSSIPEGANEADYKKETKKINSDENLTRDNYQKVANIFNGRLEDLNVEDYKLRLDKDKGNIVLELTDDLKTDTLLQYLTCKGDFNIKDAVDGTILLDKSDVKSAGVLYSNASSTGVTVYLDIKFNKEGAKKLEEISKKYVKPENTEENTNSTDKTNKVTLTIEGNEMLTTHFDEELKSGELTISLGTSTDQETLQAYIEQGNFYSMLINNDEMPITYKVQISEEVQGNLSKADIYMIIGIIIGISLIIVFYLVARYKSDGIFATISIVAGFGILLLIVRYTSTEISLNSIGAIILLIILETYLLSKMLNSIKKDNSYENVNKAMIKTYMDEKEVLFITLIISVVFTFMQYVQAFSFGMILFYGMISIAISNLILLRTMILAKYSKN